MIRSISIACICLILIAGQAMATKNVIVVLDDSGSMNEPMARQKVTRMLAAKRALVKVLEILPDETHVGVVLLNGRQNIPLGPVDMERVQGLLDQVEAGGGTPLGKFMKVAADALLEARQKDHYGTYRLLLVTDGEASDEKLVNRYLPDILSRGLTVDVIGVDMQETHSLATRVHSYRQADNPDSLAQAITEVFAETTADTSDAGESDFEVLEAFPEGMAAAAINALSSGGNRPIGEKAGGVQENRGNGSRSAPGAPNQKNNKRGLPSVVWIVAFLVLWSFFGKLWKNKSNRR